MQDLIDKLNKLTNFQKAILLVVIIVVMIIFYWFLGYQPKRAKIKQLLDQKSKVEIDLAEKKAIADNLPKFQEEVARLDEELQKQLKKLPNKAEIPKLLRTISNLGKKAGLEFSLFSPEGESKKDFYAEVPVSVTMDGNYHQIALFFDKISKLDRIVNVRQIRLKSPKEKGGKMVVQTQAQLVTYRFIEQPSK